MEKKGKLISRHADQVKPYHTSESPIIPYDSSSSDESSNDSFPIHPQISRNSSPTHPVVLPQESDSGSDTTVPYGLSDDEYDPNVPIQQPRRHRATPKYLDNYIT